MTDEMKHSCPDCPAFGKHCPHKVDGDPYYYNCQMTVDELEEIEAELRKDKEKLIKAKELLRKAMKNTWSIDCFVVKEIKQFLEEVEE